MKTELSLQEIKEISFDVLKHFCRFCTENNIRFFLSNGTLLGAIKYSGFIPWDDDIDVFVPREDYDRLVKSYQDSDRYKLFSPERVAEYRFPFSKLCDMTTLKEENNIDNVVSLGVDIDIFPLDYCSEHILRPNVQRKLKIYQIGCVLSKFTSSKGKPIHKRCIIRACRMLGFRFFSSRLIKTVNKESALGSSHIGCLMWPIYGQREVVPADVFSDTIEVDFEGEKFPAPAGYDVYLRSLYGDYEKDPPLDKQKSHHNYNAYRI